MVLGPREATERMLKAGTERINFYTEDGSWEIAEDVECGEVYRAMIAAATEADNG